MLPRDDGPEELATTTEVLEEEDVTEVSTTTTDASIEESEDKMRLSERLQCRRLRCIYGLRKLITMTAALAD